MFQVFSPRGAVSDDYMRRLPSPLREFQSGLQEQVFPLATSLCEDLSTPHAHLDR